MNEDELNRIKQIKDLMDSDKVKQKDFKQFYDMILSLMKELKGHMETMMSGKHDMAMNECQKIMSDMTAMEKKMSDMMKTKCSMVDMDKAIKSFMASINDIKQSIPTMPDLSVLEGKISEVEASIPVIKEETPAIIATKLETLKGDDRLDASAIKNIPKIETVSRPFIGGRVGIQVFDDSSKVDTKINEISFGSGLAVSKVNGRVTVTTTGGGTGYTKATPTGALGQTVFTVTNEPVYVIADGATYFDGAGYTYTPLTITLDIAPISYIRYFY